MARRELSMQEIETILRTENVGTLSMIDANGLPYAVPLHYVYEKEKQALYFHCGKNGRKIDALKKNAQVFFTVVGKYEVVQQRYSTRYESVMIQADAQFLTDPEEKKNAFTLFCAAITPEMDAQGVIEKSLAHVNLVMLKIKSVSGKANNGAGS